MSETLGSMEGLELRQDEAERTYWYDKEQKKRISEAEALGFLNVDSEQSQQPIKAIWHNQDHDVPVTISGIHGRINDEDYLRADETNAGIPRSELEFEKPQASEIETTGVSLTPEVRELIEQTVHQETEKLREYIEKLEDDNARIRAQNEELEAENLRLKDQLSNAPTGDKSVETEQKDSLHEQLREEFGDNWVPRRDGAVNFRDDDGYINDGYTVISDPEKDPDGDWYVYVQKGDEEPQRVWVGDVSRTRKVIRAETEIQSRDDTDAINETTLGNTTETDDERRPNFLRRAGAGIGGFLVGRQVRIHNGYYNVADRWGRNPTIIDAEEGEILIEEDERRGALVGAAAVGVVIGAVLAELVEHKIWGHSSGPKVINHYNTVTVPGSNGHEVLGTAVPGPNTSGRHIDYYNSGLTHRKTGVDLPKAVHLAGATGHQRIVDSNGNTIVPHSKLEWDRQGNLSRATRAYLRAKNYALTQGKLGRRYMTYLWQK